MLQFSDDQHENISVYTLNYRIPETIHSIAVNMTKKGSHRETLGSFKEAEETSGMCRLGTELPTENKQYIFKDD